MTSLDKAIAEFQQRNYSWSKGGLLKETNLLRVAIAGEIPSSNVSAITAVSQRANHGLLVSADDFVACCFVRGVFKQRVENTIVLPRADIVSFDATPNISGGFEVEIMTRGGSLSMTITHHLTNPKLEATLILEEPKPGLTDAGSVAEVAALQALIDAEMPAVEAAMARESAGATVQQLPVDIVQMMERFGRHEFDPMGPQAKADTLIWAETQAPLSDYARENPVKFASELADAVILAGGWAAYGASHTLFDLASELGTDNVSVAAVHDQSIAFLRETQVPPSRLNGFLRDRWIERGKTMATWLPLRTVPSLVDAPISDLEIGETRYVAQLAADPNSNRIAVTRSDDGIYHVMVDRIWSLADPRRSLDELEASESLFELYVFIGEEFQSVPYECDAELEPYFPIRRSTLPL